MPSLLLVALTTAFAQDPAYDRAADVEEVDKPETALVADFGGVYVSGNSTVLSLNGGLNGYHKWKANRFSFHAGTNFNWARADLNANGTLDEGWERIRPMQATSQRAFGGIRYDRFFGSERKNSLYISAFGEHDRFAGVFWRFNQQIGYRRVLVDNETTALNLEVGAAVTEENLDISDADGNDIATLDAYYPALRIFLGFQHQFNDSVSIGNNLELLENLSQKAGTREEGGYGFGEDFRGSNEFWLAAKLSDRFSFRISDRISWDLAPTPGFLPWDNTVSVALVATLL